MNRLLSFFTAMLTVWAIFLLAACQQSTPALTGRWNIVRVADSAPISAMSPEEEQAQIGKTIALNPTRLVFEDLVCDGPMVQWARTSSQTFFDDYRIEAKPDWLQGSKVVEFSCQRGSFITPVLVQGDRLLFVLDGVLFEAKRIELH